MNFCFWKERPSLISRILNSKQESIPVGYVPIPVGWGWEGGGKGIPYHRIPYPLDILTQPPDTLPLDTLPPGFPTPWKGPGTRDTLPTERTCDQ